jgi:hypothetical protein
MTPATLLRDQLADTVTELDRVLAMVSSADGHARVLHRGCLDVGIRDTTATLADLRQTLDDVTKQIASVRGNLDDCAEVVRRDVIGTGEVREPAAQSAPQHVGHPVGTSTDRTPPRRYVDWTLVRLLLCAAGLAVAIAVPILDSWLHLVSISDELYQPAFTVLLLGSLSIGYLDRYRIPRASDVAFQLFVAVALASTVMITDVTGWHELTAGSAAAAIIVLTLNTVVGVVVLPRHRSTRTA